MQQNQEFLQLVRQAVAGDRQSLSALAECVRGRVCAYLRRVVLNEDRAEDLTQETMMAMLNSIEKLREPARFWPWIFTIACNSVRQSYRQIDARPPVLSQLESPPPLQQSDEPQPADILHRRELIEITRSAIGDLDIRSRMVVGMRFYEDMPHSEISAVLGCSEMTTRVILLRAKRSLIKSLRKRGLVETVRGSTGARRLTAGAALAVALTAFGEATRPAAAQAIRISVPVLRESILAWLLTRKVTTIAATILLALFIGSGLARIPSRNGSGPARIPSVQGQATLGIHFTELSVTPCLRAVFEQWYQFPDGEGGPFFSSVQRWDPKVKVPCTDPLLSAPFELKGLAFIQNDSANYCIVPSEKSVYIKNARLYNADLLVETLPTDSESLLSFIHTVQSSPGALPTLGSLPVWNPHSATARTHSEASSSVAVQRDTKTGYVMRKVDYRFPELGPPFESTFEYAPQSADLFHVPTEAKFIDQRDEAHKRGWTCFRISGEVDGTPLTGRGQIPFVYSAYKSHKPWLHLRLEGNLEILDESDGASISRLDGSVPQVSFYPGNTFLSGLRPWIGFHSIDLIRRDAALFRVPFETRPPDPQGQVSVRLLNQQGSPPSVISYRINLDRDLVEQIVLVSQDEEGLRTRGTITLEYLEQVEGLESEFSMPVAPSVVRDQVGVPPGPSWPVLLLKASRVSASNG